MIMNNWRFTSPFIFRKKDKSFLVQSWLFTRKTPGRDIAIVKLNEPPQMNRLNSPIIDRVVLLDSCFWGPIFSPKARWQVPAYLELSWYRCCFLNFNSCLGPIGQSSCWAVEFWIGLPQSATASYSDSPEASASSMSDEAADQVPKRW